MEIAKDRKEVLFVTFESVFRKYEVLTIKSIPDKEKIRVDRAGFDTLKQLYEDSGGKWVSGTRAMLYGPDEEPKRLATVIYFPTLHTEVVLSYDPAYKYEMARTVEMWEGKIVREGSMGKDVLKLSPSSLRVFIPKGKMELEICGEKWDFEYKVDMSMVIPSLEPREKREEWGRAIASGGYSYAPPRRGELWFFVSIGPNYVADVKAAQLYGELEYVE